MHQDEMCTMSSACLCKGNILWTLPWIRTDKSRGLNKPVGFLALQRFCGSRLRHQGAKFCIATAQSDTRNLSNAADAHVTGCEGLIPARHRLPLLLLSQSLGERKHQVHIGMHRLFDSRHASSGALSLKAEEDGKIWNPERICAEIPTELAAKRFSSLVVSQAGDLIICASKSCTSHFSADYYSRKDNNHDGLFPYLHCKKKEKKMNVS